MIDKSLGKRGLERGRERVTERKRENSAWERRRDCGVSYKMLLFSRAKVSGKVYFPPDLEGESEFSI